MRNPERNPLPQIPDAIKSFVNNPSTRIYSIKGNPHMPVKLSRFFGIFNENGQEEFKYLNFTGEAGSSDFFSAMSRIYRLEIPQRIRDLDIRADDSLAKTLEAEHAKRGEPSVILGFGLDHITKEEIVRLFTVRGIDPTEALRILKDQALDTIARNN